ncbi:hypothetical protein SAMN02746066_04296 [Anaerosporobacter mobilis DSM 15930]|uniref:Uncharacterized protein n=1 Tax=Anaerosporobacter mobilis DSM 15930 TaxID=1120996 RepID=A0A1M7N8S5_9FIRM|nr:hypothetical protein [Anaerosporobacter mobilis]SHM99989.1 hypothetical protein SAMN02746066_04296 [Anaerosporobacter mobilis DSM 15930]
MGKDDLLDAFSEFGFNVLMEKGKKLHNEMELRKRIKDFVEKEFNAKFENLPLDYEIDFEGLNDYLNNVFMTDIYAYFFKIEKEDREKAYSTIISKSLFYSKAKNNELIVTFIDNLLNLISTFKSKDFTEENILLGNLQATDIINSINSSIKQVDKSTSQEIQKLRDELTQYLPGLDFKNIVSIIDGYIHKGEFDAVKNIEKIVSNNDLSIYINVCFLWYFYEEKNIERYLNEIKKIKEDIVKNASLAFIAILYLDRDKEIKKLIDIATDGNLIYILNILLEKNYELLYQTVSTKEGENNIIKFEVKYSSCEYQYLQKQIIFRCIEKEVGILNLSEVLQEIFPVSDFEYRFKYLIRKAKELYSRGNQYHTEELQEIYKELLGLKIIYYNCADVLCKTYLVEMFSLAQVINNEIAVYEYDQLSESLKSDIEIKSLYYEGILNNGKCCIDKFELLDFATENQQFVLLNMVFTKYIFSIEELNNYWDEHLYLLRKNIIAVHIYYDCFKGKKSNKEIKINISKCNNEYNNQLEFYLIILKLQMDEVLVNEVCKKLVSGEMKFIQVYGLQEFSYLCINSGFHQAVRPVLEKYSYVPIIDIILCKVIFDYYEEERDILLTKVVNLLENGYNDSDIYEIKAMILQSKGYQLEAIKNFKYAFSLNPNKYNTILNLLYLSIHNNRNLDLAILESAKQFNDTQMLYMIAGAYDYLGDKQNQRRYITKSLLTSDEYVKEVYNAYLMAVLLQPNSKNTDDPERVDDTSTVFLKYGNENRIISFYNDENMLPGSRSKFADAEHYFVRSQAGVKLLRKKKDDKVNLDGKEYVVDNILQTDKFLFQYCLRKLDEMKGIIAGHLGQDGDMSELVSILKTYTPSDRTENNLIALYSEPRDGIPISFYSISGMFRCLSDTIEYLLLNESVTIWNTYLKADIEIEDRPIVVTYSASLMLYLLGVPIDKLTVLKDIYVESVTSNSNRHDYEAKIEYYNKDDVTSIFQQEDKLYRNEVSEDVKEKELQKALDIYEYIYALNNIESASEPIKEIGISIEDMRKMLGDCDYYAMCLVEEEKAYLVTEDIFLIKSVEFMNLGIEAISIFTLITQLDLNLENLLNIIENAIKYRFQNPWHICVIKYISEKYSCIVDEEKRKQIIKRLLELMIPNIQDEKYIELVKNDINALFILVYNKELVINADIENAIQRVVYYYNQNIVRATLRSLFVIDGDDNLH